MTGQLPTKAAAAMIFRAVGSEPVKDSLSMSGWLLSGPPAHESTFSVRTSTADSECAYLHLLPILRPR